MLKLLVNNKIVELPPNTSIQWKFKNPAFNKEGAFSYPLKAPVEPNRVAFGHADAEDNLEIQSPPFKLYLGDELFISGDVKIPETQGRFEFYLKAGKSEVANVLKNSYLNDSINGLSWGNNPDGITGLNNSVNGKYPDYLMTVFPIKTDDFIVNDWDLDDQKLIDHLPTVPSTDLANLIEEGQINPVVYVKHVIKRLFSALGLIVNVNDMDVYNDFTRLCLFSHKKGYTTSEALAKVANWLPRITAADLLNDLRSRFNLVAYFNPFLGEVEYQCFERVFSSEIVDWTSKYIRSETTPGKEEAALFFENDGDDDDVITYDDLANINDLVVMADYAAMIADVRADFEKYGLDMPDKHYQLSDSERVFKAESKYLDADLTGRYYVEALNSDWLDGYFQLVKDTVDATQYNKTQILTADVQDIVFRYRFPVDFDGRVIESIFIRQLGLYVVSGGSIDIELRVFVYNADSSESKQIASTTVSIDNADPYEGIFNTVYGVKIPIGESPEIGVGWNYLYFEIYAKCSTDGELGVKQGQQNPDNPFYVYAEIDGLDRRVTELGRIANYAKGKGDDPESYSPKSKILLNDKDRLSDYLFQMPVSDMSPKLKQTDFAYTFYRGLINSEVDGDKTAPYANFDEVDINMAEYLSRLTNGDDPDMTLRWQNANGITKKFWTKTINWILHYRRPVRKVFDLSVNDLVNFKMNQRVRVDNKLYVVNVISVKANSDGTLSEATVDMFTL